MNNSPNQFFSAVSEERIMMTDELFIIITDALNKIHGTTYSQRFWKIITAPYVSAVISSRQILEQNDTGIKPTTDVYASTLTPGIKTIIYSKVRYLTKVIRSFLTLVKIKAQLKTAGNIAMGFHYPKTITPEVDVYIKTYFPYLIHKDIDHVKRSVPIEKSLNYSKAFVTNMIKLMPKLYIEYFESLMTKIPVYDPKNKIFHVSFFESFFQRLLIAKYSEQGAKLYYYQHGSYYGEYKFHSAHHHESSIADKFITWGWKITENDVPGYAYRLEGYSRTFIKHNNKKTDLLLIYPNIYNQNIEYYKTESRLFFDNIDRSKYPVIIARPRPTFRFKMSSTLYFIKKDVNKIDSGYTRLNNLISKSKIVIQMTYPSTNMFECLYVDQPVIGILNNDNPSEIIKPYYDFFLEKGMLHHTMSSMINHLNTIELEHWWMEIIQHPTYLAFKHEFLRNLSIKL